MAEYLQRENLTVFDKSHTDENGQTVTVLFSRSREVSESDLPQDDGETAAKFQTVFSTENESPFAEFTPSLKQTGVFFDRFFNGLSCSDLAAKYEISDDNARKTFRNAVNRLLEVLKIMDSDKPLDLSRWKTQIEERSGRLSKGQRWFLMNKLWFRFFLAPQ